MKKKFNVTGMSCAACSAHVDKAVRSIPGVSDVSVNLLANSMTVIFDDSIVTNDMIFKAVEHAGYKAAAADKINSLSKASLKSEFGSEYRKNVIKLIVSGVLLLILMYLGMGHMLRLPLGIFDSSLSPALNTTIQMILAAVIIGINFKYYRSGFSKLFRLAPNMDSLVAMGSAISFIYSCLKLINIFKLTETDFMAAVSLSHNLYFESSAMILVFISIGKTLEAKSKVRTRDSIEDLMKLKPETAVRITDGTEEVIPTDDIRVNDILVVRSGQQIPADGIIINGSCSVDESVLTGESVPSDKASGDNVFQATIISSGYIEVKVTKSDSDSALSEIIRTVEEAASSKAPVSRLADRISAVFVPMVLGFAVITYAIWRFMGADIHDALNFAITVIVISCPCSLGLATPTAITVGTGKAAKLGILFKSASVLENCHDVDTVVLDKTGTITTGELKCSDVIPATDTDIHMLMRLAVSAEKSSSHPIGRCIYDYCSNQISDAFNNISDYEEVAGGGISCTVEGKPLKCGNYAFVSQYCKIDDNLYRSVIEKGVTPILFCYNNKYMGLIAVEDSIKQDSSAAVTGLKDLGLDIYMLTGDIAKTAESIAYRAGISNVKAEVKPSDKEKFISELRSDNHKVVMIGDGINDAPALTAADVGIAIGTGTDIAIDSADVILTHGSLVEAVNTIDLSRKVMKNIRQNLFWAFFYNCLGLPIAAGVFSGIGISLNPMIAAALMSCSSLFVVSNALRLNLYKPILKTEDKNMTFKVIVEGMMCMHCRANVEKAFNAVSGITASVDLETKTASVETTRDVTIEELKKIVEDAGYTVSAITRLS